MRHAQVPVLAAAPGRGCPPASAGPSRTAPSLRSLLFVPGGHVEWVSKGIAAGADAIILDLEDAVPEERKATARAAVAEFLQTRATVPIFVRINGLHSRAALDDLESIVPCRPWAVMVPKVESVSEVALVDRIVGWLEDSAGISPNSIGLLPVLETAKGIRNAFQIAEASARCICMGGIGVRGGDVERALGYRWTRDASATLHVRSKVLLDVRAAGIPNPVTGLWTDIADMDGLYEFARQGRDLGYEGMLAIHPAHLATINDVFTPTSDELDSDAQLVAAFEAAARAGVGAITNNGHMVDEAMAATARARLARYRP